VFIDEVRDPKAVTIVISGMTDIIAGMTEAAVRDGLRALKYAIEDGKVLPGGGSIEIGLHLALMNEFRRQVEGKGRFAVDVFAEALLAIPRALIQNTGLEASIIIPIMLNVAETGELAGVDLDAGEVIDPTWFGFYDNYRVVRGILQSAPIVASQLLLVDEIIQTPKIIERKKDRS
jgi:T-complex protein 1 subunit zeta